MPCRPRPTRPFRWFDSSPEVIRLVAMMYVRYPLSLRNVEDLLHERGVDICHETVRLWVDRFGPMFAGEVRKRRVQAMRQHTHRDGAWTRSTSASTACSTTSGARWTTRARCSSPSPPSRGTRRQRSSS